MRRLPILLASSVVVIAVAATVLGTGEPTAACLPKGCDCEAVGAGPIRQPMNAWSSLSVAVVGIAVLGTRSRHALDPAIGIAAMGSGVAAFWYHAVLAAWTARLDGIAVAAILGLLAARVWSDRVAPPVALGSAALLLGAAVPCAFPDNGFHDFTQHMMVLPRPVQRDVVPLRLHHLARRTLPPRVYRSA